MGGTATTNTMNMKSERVYALLLLNTNGGWIEIGCGRRNTLHAILGTEKGQ